MNILKNGVTLVTFLIFSALTTADPIINWDWNDGTTQGWTSSDSAGNSFGAFQANNNGNGSLQIWGPTTSLNGANGITFKANLMSYSSANSPSDLTGSVSLRSYGTGDMYDVAWKSWDIDFSQLNFGAWEEFSFSLDDATDTSYQDFIYDSNNVMVEFFIRNKSGSLSNQSVMLIDDFVVSGNAVPIPAGIYLFLSGLVGLGLMRGRNG